MSLLVATGLLLTAMDSSASEPSTNPAIRSKDPLAALAPMAQRQVAHYLQLANDQDAVTGLWREEGGDDASPLYTLIERQNGQYQVSNHYPRRTVTWWTGKVEVHGGRVDLWNYRIIGGQLSLPDHPTQILDFDGNGQLAYRKPLERHLHLVKDKEELAELATVRFTTGQSYLEAKLAETRKHRKTTPHYDLIESAPAIGGQDIHDLEVVGEESDAENHYALFRIALSFPPGSGANGCIEERGYYWVHLVKKDQWEIAEDWRFTRSQDRDGAEAIHAQDGQGGFEFHTEKIAGERTPQDKRECFEMSNLRTKPTPPKRAAPR